MRKVAGPARRLAGDLATYGFRTGRWWVPLVAVILAIATVLVAVVNVAVPTAVYVFF